MAIPDDWSPHSDVPAPPLKVVTTPFVSVKNLFKGSVLRGNCTLGQLLASGYKMARANGRRVRAAYKDKLNLEDGFFRSTQIDRAFHISLLA